MSNGLTAEEKATNCDTYRHIERVRNLLNVCVFHLLTRAELHDQSKLESPEVEPFTEYTPKLSGCTYGSDEYKGYLASMKPALDHHYANNRHHPEHFRWHCPVCNGQFTDQQYEDAPQGPNDTGWRYCHQCSGPGLIYETQLMLKPELGVNGMTLIDLIEMLCDWKAASERHRDGCIRKSIEINTKRFTLSQQLAKILENTVSVLYG